MKPEVTFKPLNGEHDPAGSGVKTRCWQIKVNGVLAGFIDSRINDLNQSYTEPGYSCTVWITWADGTLSFRRNSGTFNNRSMKEALENRSRYVAEAKRWFKGLVEKGEKQHEIQ